MLSESFGVKNCIQQTAGDESDDTGGLPTLAAVMDSHPSVKIVVNKVKKQVKSLAAEWFQKASKRNLDQHACTRELLSHVVTIVGSVFEFPYADLVIALFEIRATTGEDFDKMLTSLCAVPSLTMFRKQLRTVLQCFGSHKNASLFLAHRTVSRRHDGVSLMQRCSSCCR